jgi:PAS domain S-box-containing protein
MVKKPFHMLLDLASEGELHRLIVEMGNEGTWLFDAAGCTVHANPRMTEMLGRTADEVLGLPLPAFVDAREHAVLKSKLARRRAGIVEEYEIDLLRPDGSLLRVLISARPLFDHGGRAGVRLSRAV